MGVTYFLLLIAAGLAGMLFYLRKLNSDSSLAARKGDTIDPLELQSARRKNELEHPKVEAYVGWYMSKSDSARRAKDQGRHLGEVYVANDVHGSDARERRYA